MNCMKIRKENGPSYIAIELFKTGRDKCLECLTNIFNDILFIEKLPGEWMLSSIVPSPFRGKRLLEHAFNNTRRFWMDVCVRW